MTVLLVPALYSAANMLAAGLSLVGLRICLAVLQRDVIMSLLIMMLASVMRRKPTACWQQPRVKEPCGRAACHMEGFYSWACLPASCRI